MLFLFSFVHACTLPLLLNQCLYSVNCQSTTDIAIYGRVQCHEMCSQFFATTEET